MLGWRSEARNGNRPSVRTDENIVGNPPLFDGECPKSLPIISIAPNFARLQ